MLCLLLALFSLTAGSWTYGETRWSGTIKAGTIMMRAGTIIPQSLRVETEPYSQGWEIIKNSDGNSVDRDVRRADWNFFFLAAILGDRHGLLGRENRTEGNGGSAGERFPLAGRYLPMVRRRWRALLGSWEIPLEACPELGTPATPAQPRIIVVRTLPSTSLTASASQRAEFSELNLCGLLPCCVRFAPTSRPMNGVNVNTRPAVRVFYVLSRALLPLGIRAKRASLTSHRGGPCASNSVLTR